MTRTDRSLRLARWWSRRYTAGLPRSVAEDRRLEIESDLAEHESARRLDDWSDDEIARERFTRLIRGAPADVAWRHDVISSRIRSTNSLLRRFILAITTAASILAAIYYTAFAAYSLGDAGIAEWRFLGGMDGYPTGLSAETVIAATVLVGLAACLIVASLTRPISPFLANVATAGTTMFLVLFFWLGVVPIGVIAVGGSIADMLLRAPELASEP